MPTSLVQSCGSDMGQVTLTKKKGVNINGIKWTTPSSMYAYCKRSKTGQWEGLAACLIHGTVKLGNAARLFKHEVIWSGNEATITLDLGMRVGLHVRWNMSWWV